MNKKRFNKIYLEITNICNLKCSFCPEGKRKKEFIKLESFEYIVNQIKDYTNLIALHVKGEPLMHPELENILKICYESGLKVNITTNATLLEKNLNILLNSPAIRQINMSLHSVNKNENNDIYNVENYINSILKVTRDLTSKTNIIISYRLWNLENLEENDENFKILSKIGNYFGKNNLPEIAKQNKFVELENNVFLNQDIEFTWPNLEGQIISESGKCWGLRNQVAILVNGDVVPCCLDQNGDIKLGNIFEEDFENIINSDFSQAFIKSFEENKIMHNLCKRCGFRTRFAN